MTKQFRNGSMIVEPDYHGNMIIYASHHRANTFRVERADVEDLDKCVNEFIDDRDGHVPLPVDSANAWRQIAADALMAGKDKEVLEMLSKNSPKLVGDLTNYTSALELVAQAVGNLMDPKTAMGHDSLGDAIEKLREAWKRLEVVNEETKG